MCYKKRTFSRANNSTFFFFLWLGPEARDRVPSAPTLRQAQGRERSRTARVPKLLTVAFPCGLVSKVARVAHL